MPRVSPLHVCALIVFPSLSFQACLSKPVFPSLSCQACLAKPVSPVAEKAIRAQTCARRLLKTPFCAAFARSD